VAYQGAVKKGGNVPLGLFLGRLHSGCPCLSLPCFSYKNRGRESRKKKREGRGPEKKGKSREENKKLKERKKIKNRGRKEGKQEKRKKNNKEE
jgi:hypothetical protein